MSRSVTITLQDRTWGALAAEAHHADTDFPTYVARILNARVADQDASDQAKRQTVAQLRTAGVTVLKANRRPAALRSLAVDAAIDRTLRAGNLTSVLMGDPEPGRAR